MKIFTKYLLAPSAYRNYTMRYPVYHVGTAFITSALPSIFNMSTAAPIAENIHTKKYDVFDGRKLEI